jgi:hypothetical protein
MITGCAATAPFSSSTSSIPGSPEIQRPEPALPGTDRALSHSVWYRTFRWGIRFLYRRVRREHWASRLIVCSPLVQRNKSCREKLVVFYRIVDDKFQKRTFLPHGRLIRENCGRIAFPIDSSFRCLARSILKSISSQSSADYGDSRKIRGTESTGCQSANCAASAHNRLLYVCEARSESFKSSSQDYGQDGRALRPSSTRMNAKPQEHSPSDSRNKTLYSEAFASTVAKVRTFRGQQRERPAN